MCPPKKEKKKDKKAAAEAAAPAPQEPLYPPYVPATLFTVDHFNPEKYDSSEYIEKLTYKLLNDAKKDEGGLFAMDFNNLFKISIQELQDLQRKVESEIVSLEYESEDADELLKHKLDELQEFHSDIMDGFKELDEAINKVGNTAVQIGDRLETSDRQNKRAVEAKDLIDYFITFNNIDPDAFAEDMAEAGIADYLPAIFVDEEDREQAAISIQKLYSFIKELEKVPGTERGRLNVKTYRQALEKKLLDEFLEAAMQVQASGSSSSLSSSSSSNASKEKEKEKERERDLAAKEALCDRMRAAASILYHLDEGESCIKNFIMTRSIFSAAPDYDVEQLLSRSGDLTLLDEVFRYVDRCVKDDYWVVQRVFANPNAIMHRFLSRVVEEKIANAKSDVLPNLALQQLDSSMSHSRGLHSYLTTLVSAYERCVEYVSKLMKYANASEEEALTAAEGIFSEEKQGHLDLEIEYLDTCYFEQINEFNRRKAEAKIALLNRGKNNSSAASKLLSFGSPSSSEHESGLGPLGQPLSLDLTLGFIHENTESLQRCIKLSSRLNLPSNVSRVFLVLLKHLHDHVRGAVEEAYDALSSKTEKACTDFLSIVQLANHIIQILQRHFESAILPHLASALSIRMETINDKNTCLYMLEEKIVRGLGMVLDTVLGHIKTTLDNDQKKADYRPREDEKNVDNDPSAACIKVNEYLLQIMRQLDSGLEGKNKSVFMAELGKQFYKILTNHLKSQTVTSAGALKLMKDVTTYIATVERMGNDLVREQFYLLKEVCNLFVVAPDSLRGLVKESTFSQLSLEELQEFLKMRSDWKSQKLARLFHVAV